jgi:hypothetical protein
MKANERLYIRIYTAKVSLCNPHMACCLMYKCQIAQTKIRNII